MTVHPGNLAGRPPLGLKRPKPERGTAAARRHIEAVKQLPCVICGASPVEVHHCYSHRYGSRKRSDFETIPLCVRHHRIGPEAIHQDKAAWEAANGPDTDFLSTVADMLAGDWVNPWRRT
ncbi:Ref family recombination enhancement nuclease [Falsirhodobacter halotolerans]|uniref:Ref family recombination enhancement nuclease n=1 Tax=Falsirhodobacter halotolerans TaxID=1146892 RepID=UPI001FD2D5F2|nr:Ref family recombination enhancement nuclease [Falsirhodobacter halotolerans]MCJ8138568.1 Ref family protein [Falsirhodobacter halotolerans]